MGQRVEAGRLWWVGMGVYVLREETPSRGSSNEAYHARGDGVGTSMRACVHGSGQN